MLSAAVRDAERDARSSLVFFPEILKYRTLVL
jgi:hypothetical protein